MPAGRRPIPTRLKVLRGNPGKRGLPKREPRLAIGLPACPAFLGERARLAWDAIGPHVVAMGVMTHADEFALAALCDAIGDWLDASALLAAEGAVYASTTPTGTIRRPHPAVMIRDGAWKRVRSMLVEFGLTPAARTRVASAAPADVDPLEIFLTKDHAAKRA